MAGFLEYTLEEQKRLFSELSLPGFRCGQVRRWVFARKTDRFFEMSDISKEQRELLSERFGGGDSVFGSKLVTVNESSDSTRKLLLELSDGHRIECVLLRDDRNHRTGCISTQVGCAMGCVFCASGLDGFVRNLSRGEILEQILRLNQLLPDTERLTHLVVMGTGEPLLNIDPLISALEDAVSPDGLDMSGRRITISTVGIPSGIRKLASFEKQYKLAISLHAPNDEIRTKIVPQNRRHDIRSILDAADDYYRTIARRVTFEYVMIDRINDRPEHASELAKLLKNRNAIVNLIPFNPVDELSYGTPSRESVKRFTEILETKNVQYKIRFRKGDRINAACGQLRRSYAKQDDSKNEI